MNEKVRTLQRAKEAVLWSGNKEAHTTVRATLKADIAKAKKRCQQRLDEDLWQAI